jgi:hypothetical protein
MFGEFHPKASLVELNMHSKMQLQESVSPPVHIVSHKKKILGKISIFSKNLAPSVIRISEIVSTMGKISVGSQLAPEISRDFPQHAYKDAALIAKFLRYRHGDFGCACPRRAENWTLFHLRS